MAFEDTMRKLREFDINDLDFDNVGTWPLPIKIFIWAALLGGVLAAGYYYHIEDLQLQLAQAALLSGAASAAASGGGSPIAPPPAAAAAPTAPRMRLPAQPRRRRRQIAPINPNDSSNAVLLGMSFLKRLELTQRGNTLTLRLP